MAHFPDTSPVGRQQQTQVNMFVVLKIHPGIFNPSNLLTKCWEKWLQLFLNMLYFPQVHTFESSYSILMNSVGSILVSPKKIFLLNWYSALYGSTKMTPLSLGSVEMTQ